MQVPISFLSFLWVCIILRFVHVTLSLVLVENTCSLDPVMQLCLSLFIEVLRSCISQRFWKILAVGRLSESDERNNSRLDEHVDSWLDEHVDSRLDENVDSWLDEFHDFSLDEL